MRTSITLCQITMALAVAFTLSGAFSPPKVVSNPCKLVDSTSRLFSSSPDDSSQRRSIFSRLNRLSSANIKDARVTGIFSRIKRLHDPITYTVLLLLAGFRWDWCFRNVFWLFAVGFCIKWYRAKYVFKIPVWDRQPNWNNIITSKEQEKDLKAYTCKKCGSTLFIAKTREFFFEGNTGIGGLGCFTCGAKGKENFVMDRDRIVEDVADVDDYFEYERPLDFVSRAERRKLLKETQGDEEKANQILLNRGAVQDATIVKEEKGSINQDDATAKTQEVARQEETSEEPRKAKESSSSPKKKSEEKPKKQAPKPSDDDDLDALDMDAF